MAASGYRVNRPTVAAETVDREVLMIHLESGNYYSLRSTAALIWEAVESSVPTDDLVGALRALGVEDPATVVARFLSELEAEGLVVASDPAGAPPDASWQPPTEVGDWGVPVLEKFTDMQHLILLDPVHEVDPAEGWPKPRTDA
jgi:hypothetical protein